jgi:hypothetical protein
MDDFCPTHGYEHMKKQFGNPIPYCEACETARAIVRCDQCDNGIEKAWEFCAWCGAELTPRQDLDRDCPSYMGKRGTLRSEITSAFLEGKMGTVTESIYSGKSTVVPLADVQHIEKRELGLVVVTKHTRWDNDGDFWANSIWIDKAEADAFLKAWCTYRSELEADTLADLSPAA